MPQMSPLWWEVLFFMFIMSFMFMNMIMYFNKKIEPKKMTSMEPKINQFKWKW
uniref:ATPase subunit 8 n=1 Tax=Enoplops sibiricus TaxID=2813412 RepID=A0A8T9ZXF9_9HEMI|nr:ATPase subunit 8 [Enoplops sibiricus]